MTKPKPKNQLQKRGRKSLFRPEYILIAKAMARVGAIDEEIADELGINRETFHNWKKKYPELANAVKAAKEISNAAVEKALYQRANGYSHPAVKAFITRDGKIVEHKYIEHYPPDTTAALFWLKNRRPDRWRDVQRVDAALGHYVIADRPLTESEWARERAIADKTIDVTPGVTPKELDGK
jgi:Homeodomain-like domain